MDRATPALVASASLRRVPTCDRPVRVTGGRDQRVLVVEEHALVAAGLRLLLSTRAWEVATSDGPTACDVIEVARRFQPHCALVKIVYRNGIGSGIDLVGSLASAGAHVVMLTPERRRTVLAECLEAGAAGWIGKDAGLDQVDHALRRLTSGGSIVGWMERATMFEALREERARGRDTREALSQLTEREALVLAALTDGLCADEIAREHYVSVTTIRSQIRAVLQKLGVHSQLAAVAVAGDHRDLLPHPDGTVRDRRRAGHPRDPVGRPEAAAHIA